MSVIGRSAAPALVVAMLLGASCSSGTSGDSAGGADVLDEDAAATVELVGRLGVDLDDSERDCVEQRSTPPSGSSVALYGVVRCVPSIIAASFSDRLAVADPALDAPTTRCVQDVVVAVLEGADDRTLEEFVVTDRLPAVLKETVAGALADCGLSDDAISAVVG